MTEKTIASVAEHVLANPKFAHLVRIRNRYAAVLTLLVVVIYFGYILLVAFNKPFLAQKLGAGWVTSLGIPLGLGVIVLTIAITVFYVHVANTRFDAMAAELLKEADK